MNRAALEALSGKRAWLARQKVGTKWWMLDLTKYKSRRPYFQWERDVNRDLLSVGAVERDTRKNHHWCLTDVGRAMLAEGELGMTTPDKGLAARLAYFDTDAMVNREDDALENAITEAYRSGQLITLADHGRLVKEAVVPLALALIALMDTSKAEIARLDNALEKIATFHPDVSRYGSRKYAISIRARASTPTEEAQSDTPTV